MSTFNLIYHPATLSKAAFFLTVTVNTSEEGALTLDYQLTGDITQLNIPTLQPPLATDGLWEHTCFEAFIALVDEPRYHEFNFSPSGQWAVYVFANTRQRIGWTTPQVPKTTFTRNENTIGLTAYIPAMALPDNPVNKPLQLGLSAVLETIDGHRSYWALHHPAPQPDFHDRTSFVLTLV